MIRLSEALARLHLDYVVQPRYVEEAYRLLKKSVIHVQTEEVTLEGGEEEEEEEEEDEEVEGPEGDAGGEDGEEGGRVRGKKKRGRTNEEGMEEEEEEDEEAAAVAAAAAAAAEAAAAAAAAAAKQKKGKKGKRKVQITVEEYRLMTVALATYVRQQENRAGGVTWGEVMEWYIQQQQEEGRAEGLGEKVTMVIARMLDVDTTLVPGGEMEGGREGGKEGGEAAAMEEGGEGAEGEEAEEEGGKRKKRKGKKERMQLLLRVHPNHPL